MKIITLLTDFGVNDVYVAVMKGAIATINPNLQVIDITHHIPPQNIAAGRFCLLNSYSYFPPDTIHIAVVDPGVGSNRRGIAIKSEYGYFIGPDNGIFSGILPLIKPLIAVELNNSKYWRVSHPSNTFHGRDIFATVGAYLATGIDFNNLGTEINLNTLVDFPLKEYLKIGNQITGFIQYIDYFGNIITNIPAHIIQGKNWSVKINDFLIPKGETYNDVNMGELVSLVGSHGWLEIALNWGKAADLLHLKLGDQVQLIITS
jgi:S-adenosyl-L-methionine hydrolase (adenosine-forming)